MTEHRPIDAASLRRKLDELADLNHQRDAPYSGGTGDRLGRSGPRLAVLAACMAVFALGGVALVSRYDGTQVVESAGEPPTTSTLGIEPNSGEANTFTIVGEQGATPSAGFPSEVSVERTVVHELGTTHVGVASESGEICVQLTVAGSGAMKCEFIAALGPLVGLAVVVTTPDALVVGGVVADDVAFVQLGDAVAYPRSGTFVISTPGGSSDGRTDDVSDLLYVRRQGGEGPPTATVTVGGEAGRLEADAVVGCAFDSGRLGVYASFESFRLDAFANSVAVDDPVAGVPAGQSPARLSYRELDDVIMIEFIESGDVVRVACAGSAVRLRGDFLWGE